MHYIDGYAFDNLNFAISYMRWRRLVDNLAPSNVLSIVLELNIKQYLYFYSLFYSSNRKEIENKIIKAKDPKFAFLFFKDIKCNKSKMKNVILNSASSKYIMKLAELDSSAIPAALNIILKNNDSMNALNLIKKFNIKNYNIVKIILKSNKPKHLLSLSKITKEKNILSKIENKLIKYNHFKYLTYFAVNNVNYDITKIEKFIKKHGSYDDALFFAKKVKRSKLNELLLFV